MKEFTGLQKLTLILLFAFLFFGGLFYASDLIIPISFAALLAMLMVPLSKRLEKWGFARGISILCCILVILAVFIGLLTLFTSQIVSFSEDLPELKKQMAVKLEDAQQFIHEKTNVTPGKQIEFAKKRLSGALESTDTLVKNILLGTTGMLAIMGLMAIYIFFFMYYRRKFKNFILMLTPREEHETAEKIIQQTGKITQHYLSGVIMVIFILAVLNSVGLMIVGLDHAIFFGCLAAVLNIIPYIGVLIGSLFPIILALLTKDFPTALAVVGIFAFNQFLENNFLTPNIVGSQVKINPLASIIAIIIGGLLWGVAGMILFIPFIGVFKIICDNVESLKPFGYLVGEEDSNDEGFFARLKKWFRVKILRKKDFKTNNSPIV